MLCGAIDTWFRTCDKFAGLCAQSSARRGGSREVSLVYKFPWSVIQPRQRSLIRLANHRLRLHISHHHDADTPLHSPLLIYNSDIYHTQDFLNGCMQDVTCRDFMLGSLSFSPLRTFPHCLHNPTNPRKYDNLRKELDIAPLRSVVWTHSCSEHVNIGELDQSRSTLP